ncbi:MAG: hypothetical protein IPN17_31850 [Deltaproteobacteria bacterium]|nr:hypothetical protein [Deltaproteobacteria bacterium]
MRLGSQTTCISKPPPCAPSQRASATARLTFDGSTSRTFHQRTSSGRPKDEGLRPCSRARSTARESRVQSVAPGWSPAAASSRSCQAITSARARSRVRVPSSPSSVKARACSMTSGPTSWRLRESRVWAKPSTVSARSVSAAS